MQKQQRPDNNVAYAYDDVDVNVDVKKREKNTPEHREKCRVPHDPNSH